MASAMQKYTGPAVAAMVLKFLTPDHGANYGIPFFFLGQGTKRPRPRMGVPQHPEKHRYRGLVGSLTPFLCPGFLLHLFRILPSPSFCTRSAACLVAAEVDLQFDRVREHLLDCLRNVMKLRLG